MLGPIIFTAIAFLLAIILVLTNHYLNQKDNRVEEVVALLPGYNCGACGFGGCQDFADNIVKEGVNPKKCKPMKEEQYQKLKEYLDRNNIGIS